MLPGFTAGMELELLYCKSLGTAISKGSLHNAWLGADVWPSGYFMVDLTKINK